MDPRPCFDPFLLAPATLADVYPADRIESELRLNSSLRDYVSSESKPRGKRNHSDLAFQEFLDTNFLFVLPRDLRKGIIYKEHKRIEFILKEDWMSCIIFGNKPWRW